MSGRGRLVRIGSFIVASSLVAAVGCCLGGMKGTGGVLEMTQLIASRAEAATSETEAVLFEDIFDNENSGFARLNYAGFKNWRVEDGSVDLIGHGSWDYFPDHGLYLDLDGSTRNAGVLESVEALFLTPGDYRLEFELAGSVLSGTDTVVVELGAVYSEQFTMNAKEPFQKIERSFRVTQPISAFIRFENKGGDNTGLLLDNVRLIREQPAGAGGAGLGARVEPTKSGQDCVFRLSSGELILGQLVAFENDIFTILVDSGFVEKQRQEVTAIIMGSTSPGLATIEEPSVVISQWSIMARASSEYSPTRWSALKATGEPDTLRCGDIETAWAPRGSGPDPEWIEVTFDEPVYATGLRVHETLNSGFITRIEFLDIYGGQYTVWQGEDTTPCPGWFELSLPRTEYLVQSAVVHTAAKGFEEIDAVMLMGVIP